MCLRLQESHGIAELLRTTAVQVQDAVKHVRAIKLVRWHYATTHRRVDLASSGTEQHLGATCSELTSLYEPTIRRGELVGAPCSDKDNAR